MWCHHLPVILALGKLKQEERKFQAPLDNTSEIPLSKQNENKNKTHRIPSIYLFLSSSLSFTCILLLLLTECVAQWLGKSLAYIYEVLGFVPQQRTE